MAISPWRKERYTIECCNGCKPPKRYPGCSDHCDEYKKQKAKHIADKKREKEYLRNNPALTNYDFDKVRSTAKRK